MAPKLQQKRTSLVVRNRREPRSRPSGQGRFGGRRRRTREAWRRSRQGLPHAPRTRREVLRKHRHLQPAPQRWGRAPTSRLWVAGRLPRGRRNCPSDGWEAPTELWVICGSALQARADALATMGTPRLEEAQAGGESSTAAEVHPALSGEQPLGTPRTETQPLWRRVTAGKAVCRSSWRGRGISGPWSRRGCPRRPVP